MFVYYLFLKEKCTCLADISHQVDSKKGIDFPLTQPHHAKVFLYAHTVKPDYDEFDIEEPSTAIENTNEKERLQEEIVQQKDAVQDKRLQEEEAAQQTSN